ncbi:MAG: GIY-YIG nuclease family protein [Candidatus Berkelbacteria bacterium]|nr:GIY-YIG nuclease family protein [Candidatus Berkelbacteria bacterium]
MYYTYVLKSQSSNHYYVGWTNNLELRIKTHNSGLVTRTKRYLPCKVIYFETFEEKTEALVREKYFKTHAGRNWLKRKLNTGS